MGPFICLWELQYLARITQLRWYVPRATLLYDPLTFLSVPSHQPPFPLCKTVAISTRASSRLPPFALAL
jgi:hypothetical protein